MLFALTTAFALSQADRTVAAIKAAPLQTDFHLGAQALGLFAGARAQGAPKVIANSCCITHDFMRLLKVWLYPQSWKRA